MRLQTLPSQRDHQLSAVDAIGQPVTILNVSMRGLTRQKPDQSAIIETVSITVSRFSLLRLTFSRDSGIALKPRLRRLSQPKPNRSSATGFNHYACHQ
jgi:hypothetical protein